MIDSQGIVLKYGDFSPNSSAFLCFRSVTGLGLGAPILSQPLFAFLDSKEVCTSTGAGIIRVSFPQRKAESPVASRYSSNKKAANFYFFTAFIKLICLLRMLELEKTLYSANYQIGSCQSCKSTTFMTGYESGA